MPQIREDATISVGMRLYDGTTFDTVVERIAYGGFGVIAFGPNQLNKGRMTAYKTLRRELLAEPQTRAGFVRECLLWMGLWGHANVAQATALTKMGDAQGLRPFLALEYAERGSLRELLVASAQRDPNQRLPFDLALHLAQQIAAGLAYLHQPEPAYLRSEPTVHRDLKPENVLLMSDGRAVITDFGLAKVVEESPLVRALLLTSQGSRPVPAVSDAADAADAGGGGERQMEEAIVVEGADALHSVGVHTAEGIALGTIPYMAPEQWVSARFAGTSADIYAFGIMLSELFAGRHALLDFNRRHTQAGWRRAHSDPRPLPLRAVASDVPEVIEAIYQRCLAAYPEDRPTAADVLAALQAGARQAGQAVYTAPEFMPHNPFNEKVYWHNWSIAYLNFDLFDEGLARNDRALMLARQIGGEHPDMLANTLRTRGFIFKELGARALARGDKTEAARLDQQVEETYQEALNTYPPASTLEGRRGRSFVWTQIGVFNDERKRFDYADDAYGRALKLQPDKADTYYNRANNQAQWAIVEAQAGRRETAIAHLRQARVYAITALGMNLPPAGGLVRTIEEMLRKLGVTDETPAEGM
jgi:serine/threonine protein kinase